MKNNIVIVFSLILSLLYFEKLYPVIKHHITWHWGQDSQDDTSESNDTSHDTKEQNNNDESNNDDNDIDESSDNDDEPIDHLFYQNPMVKAIEKGNVSKVKGLLKSSRFNVNIKDTVEGKSLLSLALALADSENRKDVIAAVEIIKLLIAAGANVQISFDQESTDSLLYKAIGLHFQYCVMSLFGYENFENFSLKIIQMLIAAGAKADQKTIGETQQLITSFKSFEKINKLVQGAKIKEKKLIVPHKNKNRRKK